MIKQLIKQIWTQRNINIWLWVELIIVSVCLAYVTDYLYRTGTTYFAPLGFDTRHVYRVYLSKVDSGSHAYIADETPESQTNHLTEILSRLRAYPGVEAVSTSLQGAHPYNVGNANGSRGIDTTWVHGIIYNVVPEYFRVFRIADKNGEIEPLVDAAAVEGTVIVSTETEGKFAEAGISVQGAGLKLWKATEPSGTIRAVCADVRFDDFSPVYPVYFHCYPERYVLEKNNQDTEICVRIASAADTPEFPGQFRRAMKDRLRLGNLYLMDITSFDDLRTNYYRMKGNINQVKTYTAGLSFLLLNIFLGVIGTFWIRTQQRRAEIGLRLALGASPTGIRSMLIAEGMLLLITATVPALIISGNLAFSELLGNEFVLDRFLIVQAITFVLVAVMIVIGISLPARQAMRVEAAEALHEE